MRRAIYKTLLRAPIKAASGALTTVGAVGTVWPTWVQSKIGGPMSAYQIELTSKLVLVAGIVYFALLWLLKPGEKEAAPERQPPSGPTTHGPQSHNISAQRDVHITHAAPAAVQEPKSPCGSARLPEPSRKPRRCPEMPMWKAVEYVSSIIGDTDEQHCYPEARRLIRQAARDERIEVWGRKGLLPEHMNAPLRCSDIWTPIEAGYWDDFKLNPLATGQLFEDREHTDAEPHVRSGILSGQYWNLRVSESDFHNEWRKPIERFNFGPRPSGPNSWMA